ncbi:catechol 2,3-dioxygenase-like lactoylglutathione lyase family enzyme [Salinibacterium sp. CAN_S4]|uniref:bleomycin resistance protein n=1 Tax=Salinibacterium sp. CAN_S4 TaxID=2787727 RepID=UPI0018EF67B3
MIDRTVPNLPSRDFNATEAFYGALGFEPAYRDDSWMILTAGDLELEFFPRPDLDPSTSSFMCSIRIADLDSLYALILNSGVPVVGEGRPRLSPPRSQPWGHRVAHLIDPDGTQLNLIEQ